MVSAGKKTRKNKSKPLSIPELRKSFQHMESYLGKQLRNNKVKSEDLVKTFRKEWQRHFRRELSVSAARSYIAHMREKLMPKHKGGSQQLIGAPLDLTTRPGVYGTHGNFLEYVNKGFSVGIPESGIQQECGVKDFSPVIPKDMGSNQAGGKRRKSTRRNRKGSQKGGNVLTGASYAASFRPFIAENPVTFQASVQNDFKGMAQMPSSDPSATAFSYKMPPNISNIGNINVAGLDRNLLKDVSVPY